MKMTKADIRKLSDVELQNRFEGWSRETPEWVAVREEMQRRANRFSNRLMVAAVVIAAFTLVVTLALLFIELAKRKNAQTRPSACPAERVR